MVFYLFGVPLAEVGICDLAMCVLDENGDVDLYDLFRVDNLSELVLVGGNFGAVYYLIF